MAIAFLRRSIIPSKEDAAVELSREVGTGIARALTVTASYTPLQVAGAYHFPTSYSGAGYSLGIVELGGAVNDADLEQYFGRLGLPVPVVEAISVNGAPIESTGPGGADTEVMIDIEISATLAPEAKVNVYFGENSEDGFYRAIAAAGGVNPETFEDEGHRNTVVSISWGQPENLWNPDTMDQFNTLLHVLRAKGVTVFTSSGDRGAQDNGGDGLLHTDFPSSSPHVISCGGTELLLDAYGDRASEVAWDIDDTKSASGGGISAHFSGRQVPDISGNASSATGYQILTGGEDHVLGGTSAVAPLMAGLALELSEALGRPLGQVTDLSNFFLTNLGVLYDVTSGDNGGFRAGPGRDNVTGLGVPDGARMLEVLLSGRQLPAPIPLPAVGAAGAGGGIPLPVRGGMNQHS
ncbi:S8 family serine peptidase [Actinoplanes sp. TBRC 11911]|uniref:S53 family peptidase n=1 Tax=Actinoplanes sp. TBRC 11911 TaxID=2729386 RepID=UPI00145C423B|nr:S53 family peptidase [Actinoplanes sp. TBRC 11911]NMO51838.1 S8 family serine peptidase [Actinoplanes sp. TBRC 11911]